MKIRVFTTLLLILSGISFSQVWVNQTNPSPGVLFSVYAYDASTAWISGELGKVLYTSNGGTNWINRTNAVFGSNNVLSIHAVNPATAFVICNINGGKVFKTVDQGFGWQTSFTRANATLCDVQFLNATTGFVFGNPVNNRFFIIKTVNAGATFDTVSINRPIPHGSNSQVMPNSTYLYQSASNGPIFIWFGTNDGYVYYSTNTGTSWDTTLIQPSTPVLSLTFSSPQNGLSGGDDPYMTLNGGGNWIFQGGYPNTGRYFSFENVAGQYFYSSGPSIYHSTNNASTFILQFTNVSKEDYRDLSFVQTANDNSLSVIHGWGVTGDGVISHYTEPIGIIPIGTNIPEKFNLYQNYPNPFNPVTTITFDIARQSSIKLDVSDILGKNVKVLFEGKINAGTYKTEFDGSDLPSGIYFYRLQSESGTITKKLMLIK
ncbi:MAG: T9SS type A sorting domain-containing protein [Ignavibacteria bacterium]